MKHKNLKPREHGRRLVCIVCVVFFAECDAPTALNSMGDGTRGEKKAWVAHILGGQGIAACPNASDAAKEDATAADTRKSTSNRDTAENRTSQKRGRDVDNSKPAAKKQKQSTLENKVFKGINIPFSQRETDAVHAQSERVVVACNLSERFFEHAEVQTLFTMFRSAASEVLPSGRLIGGRLLDEAARNVDERVKKELKGKRIGIQ
jgi:hypothetical protein